VLGHGGGLELVQRLDGLGVHQLDHFVGLYVLGEGGIGTQAGRRR
jgi:hypothetical protein